MNTKRKHAFFTLTLGLLSIAVLAALLPVLSMFFLALLALLLPVLVVVVPFALVALAVFALSAPRGERLPVAAAEVHAANLRLKSADAH